MTKVTWKPGTMLSPLPCVLVTSGTMKKPNVMTVAWAGIVCSDPVLTYVSIRPSRYSYELIKKNKEFVINVPTWKMVGAVDFCGVKSGKKMDKFKETGITPVPSQNVAAPQIEECPITMECKVKSITPYGTHDMFLAEVVSVNIDEQYINEQGALNLDKAGLLAYAHGNYYSLGRNLGSFGFSVNKTLLKRQQQMAKVEVVEKKPSPLNKNKPERSDKTKSFKPADKKGKFAGKKNFSDKKKHPHGKEPDIIKATISRPDKRYDKVKKVKTEYLKTEDFSSKKTMKSKTSRPKSKKK